MPPLLKATVMNPPLSVILSELIDKGVIVRTPHSVDIDPAINPGRISGKGITLHTGCRISGSETFIAAGVELGAEAPVTIDNCWIGPGVKLKGGYFSNAVFLRGASMGSGAHVRGGTILEEGASGAHTVGLKQTVLMPFVTLGSLINFCDCFMAGGTSASDHSEVGSSYIHFNYTPNQDKATASLIGDVPRGVMLRQRPIFLGGQGGLVGPCRIEYGTIIAAGSIYRKDQLKPDMLVFEGGGRGGKIPFTPGLYRSVKRQVKNNLIYLGNLFALRQWYAHVRRAFIGPHQPEPLWEGLCATLEKAIDERLKRLDELRRKMPRSIKIYKAQAGEAASGQLLAEKQTLFDRWPAVVEGLIKADISGDLNLRDRFLKELTTQIQSVGTDYVPVIQALSPESADLGTRWLQGIVDTVISISLRELTAFA
jgi:bifunctional UDP-N-acetylglucosamine pyrophosphorylase / glucosamine-1-phosphate N-acetyltransferase